MKQIYQCIFFLLLNNIIFYVSGPSTNYSVWVIAIENGLLSKESDTLFFTTDLSEPSPPKITNLTCFRTGEVYVEWTMPGKQEKF